MAFELGDSQDQGMSEINLIPLIDIMLVLMIIFLVTATVLNPSVPLDLPKTTAQINQLPPKVIQVSIDANETIFWDDQKISIDELQARFAKAASGDEDPQVQLRADKNGKYDTVAQVLASASTAGLSKIAFVND
ncbi:biopolymer transporter ExbD [Moraxella nasovis]|uniref:ExbD/TolR family protein n=1 Tax=Moraxella nasovis TaxID=2904121 RepID=UPI001F61509C|nr:biopolymer transporter ExbD [Moraxella nasovis]UNU73322.1 biopolymer transporter ExbD [Moraxella nasovis]